MKYGVIPSGISEHLALASGRVPIPLLDAVLGPMKARAIMAGVSLGVFEALRDGSRTPDQLAIELGLHSPTLEMLLRMLVVCGYLVQERDGFILSRVARRTMVTGASMQTIGYLRFNYTQWEMLDHLESLVQTGTGRDLHDTMTDVTRWRDYQLGMLELARIECSTVVPRIPVHRGAVSLLDVAGGHGLFGAALCRKHPPMRSTVLELPQAASHARALASEAGLCDVVTHREGNALTSDLGIHDVVLLFNILHHFTGDTIASVLHRARKAFRGRGTIAIWEIEAPRKHSRVSNGDAAALFFRLTSTAGAYHGDDYVQWMRDAGFTKTSVSRPVTTPGKVLVVGRCE